MELFLENFPPQRDFCLENRVKQKHAFFPKMAFLGLKIIISYLNPTTFNYYKLDYIKQNRIKINKIRVFGAILAKNSISWQVS